MKLLYTMVGLFNTTTTVENETEAPQKIKNRMTIQLSTNILGIYPKNWNQDLKDVSALPCSL